ALNNLEKGARVHDIGKIGIRDNVLNKHGPLTKHEFGEMQRHTTIGAKILEPVKSLQSIVPIVRSHHERVDGTGYPDGLNGQNIPIEARIVAVADCFDAMTTDRPNRKAFPVAKAIEEIKHTSGTHFDKEIVDAFLIAYSGKQIWTDNTKTKNKKSA
ncbi:MAG: HD domain-containing protein, partial [Actinobacteria bacterium]